MQILCASIPHVAIFEVVAPWMAATRPCSVSRQALQGELQNSEAKGVGLERQVSQLSARINRSGPSSFGSTSGGNISGRSWGGESEAVCGGGGGSGGGKSSEVIEAGMASLRRQINAANEVGTAL